MVVARGVWWLWHVECGCGGMWSCSSSHGVLSVAVVAAMVCWM